MTAAKPTGITTLCRSCGAPIWWAHTLRGRAIPIDSEPVDDGNVVATGRQTVSESSHFGAAVARPEVRVEDPGMFPDERLRYRAHFTTCPNADEWRHR